ncbi:MAG: MBL fold metallo-hydrolase [Thermomicrobiales bacterium]
MRFVSFGSGSSGNAFLLDTGEARIMIDCGVGIRKLRRAMVEQDFAGTIDALVISHEHIDHVRALKSLLRYEDCRVFSSDGTLDALGRQTGWQTLKAGNRQSIAGIDITPVGVSHDAAEPLGFLIETKTEKIALFTDLGAPAEEVSGAISEASIVVLESNYCETMLRRSAYPAHLKRRIRSQNGHLSNDDCAATLVDALRPSAHTLWLAHLSENNNAPDVAEGAVRESLAIRGIGLPVRALPRFDAVDLLIASNRDASWQTSLFS